MENGRIFNFITNPTVFFYLNLNTENPYLRMINITSVYMNSLADVKNKCPIRRPNFLFKIYFFFSFFLADLLVLFQTISCNLNSGNRMNVRHRPIYCTLCVQRREFCAFCSQLRLILIPL